MRPWYSSQDDISVAYKTLDLDGLVSIRDAAEGERYVLGNERGLATRIVGNICDPVTTALSVANLSNLRFADIQAASSNPSKTPDVVLLSLDRPGATGRRHMKMLCVGEYKPMWTVDLHDFPITSFHGRSPNYEAQASLRPHSKRNQQTTPGFPSMSAQSIVFGHDGRASSQCCMKAFGL